MRKYDQKKIIRSRGEYLYSMIRWSVLENVPAGENFILLLCLVQLQRTRLGWNGTN